MVAEPPIDSPSAVPLVAATPSLGEISLGAELEVIAFTPGRYSTAIQRTLQGTHALQRLAEDSTAAFALDLAADGSATACRGWRYHFTNDGPKVHTDERFREQQGYRGRYTVTDGVAEVELSTDDTVCPARRESELALARATIVKLRCVLVTPHDHPMLRTTALLCQWGGVTSGEAAAHVVSGLGPEGWMVLGASHGLRVKVTGRPVAARAGTPIAISAEQATAPLGADAWEQPF
jgi:hypothetical protein